VAQVSILRPGIQVRWRAELSSTSTMSSTACASSTSFRPVVAPNSLALSGPMNPGWAHNITKQFCTAVYNACLLGVGLANLECKIEQHIPASPISPVSPIVCGDLTKQLEQAECSRKYSDCMDGDQVLP